ncbi:MAG: STAS domain-containing protein [Planctomycetes bacterium]|nr:STAS domain-containing protein [Planctomycetota bacterium]MBL7041491.1 STAS domain-containing protein [Pirellulaceae bacterium]
MESTRSVCPVCRASSHIDDVYCSDCGHGQWFRLQDIDGAVILTVLPGMSPERDAIDRIGGLVVEAKTSPHIIVNLAHVRFVSSTFVNRFLSLLKTVNASQGKLTLCSVGPAIRDVFRLMNLEPLFDFGGSEAVAL